MGKQTKASGFNPEEWIGVFKAGDYGYKGTYTAEDVAELAEQYDPLFRKAPATIGHPPWAEITGEQKAHGWVNALKAVAGVLYAKFENISQELFDGIRSGHYKGRSIGFMPKKYSGTGQHELWHVAFLGASTPHSTGLLPTFTFSEEDQERIVSIDFSDSPQPKGEPGTSQPLTATNQDKDQPLNKGTDEMDKEQLEALQNDLKKLSDQVAELSKRPDISAEELAGLKQKSTEFDALNAQKETLETALAAQAKADAEKDITALFENVPPSLATEELKAIALSLHMADDQKGFESFEQFIDGIKAKFAYLFRENVPGDATLNQRPKGVIEGADETANKIASRAEEILSQNPNISRALAQDQAYEEVVR